MSLFSPDPSTQAALSSVDYAQDLLGSDVSGASLQVKTEDSWEDSFRETCPICGDKVSGYHYGLLTCESCKGFFKRTVQNDKRYTCLEKQSCPIDKAQRTRCPSCRFHKCLSVGMRLEAVRADRTRGGRNKLGPLYRRDRQLKQQRRGLDSSPAGISVYGIKLEYSFQPQGGAPPTPSPSPCSYEDSQSTGLGFSSPLESPLPGCLPELCDPYCQEVKSEWLCSSQVRPPLPSPSLLPEMMHCELEEAALRAWVLGHLQRELASRGKHDRLNTLGIMCRVADQTLFALVEWVRGCIFFKQLTVTYPTLNSAII
ncbi:steroidogenic factor 1-like [Huso huso]|uniref:Steroidogenic factor 1-like n=1 Tax=Huso huso TaxID=61971 RepID=A0ABR0Y0T9_HUSHU